VSALSPLPIRCTRPGGRFASVAQAVLPITRYAMACGCLFQADQRDRTAPDVLADGVRHSRSHEGQPLGEYAVQLVKGYANHVYGSTISSGAAVADSALISGVAGSGSRGQHSPPHLSGNPLRPGAAHEPPRSAGPNRD
jgi:hypothetical protein